MTIVIHHNEGCGTSRRALELIRAAGHEPVIIDYLAEGWSRPQLLALFAAAGLTPRSALRVGNWDEARHGVLDETSDEGILTAMLTDPVLVQRPIVCCAAGTRLCRPAETVQALLEGLKAD